MKHIIIRHYHDISEAKGYTGSFSVFSVSCLESEGWMKEWDHMARPPTALPLAELRWYWPVREPGWDWSATFYSVELTMRGLTTGIFSVQCFLSQVWWLNERVRPHGKATYSSAFGRAALVLPSERAWLRLVSHILLSRAHTERPHGRQHFHSHVMRWLTSQILAWAHRLGRGLRDRYQFR